MIIIGIVVVVVDCGENTTCTPNKLILLSNCSFHYFYHRNHSSHLFNHITTNDNRTLSMILQYPLHKNVGNDLLMTIITHKKSAKPLIRFNLSMIQCSNMNMLSNWTSLEYSSTLRGEFVRTTFVDKNIMYLPSGKTYIKNLTTLDCLTKTLYRTDHKQLFKLDLRIESTLNDYCSNEHLCYPSESYECDQIKHRCTCREPLQSYSIENRYPICVQLVQNMDQCEMKNLRCLEWCHENSSSSTCTCPKNISTKISLDDDDRAYCESQTSGICNSLIQCPLNETCLHGICQNQKYKSYHSVSIHIVTMAIIVSCLFLLTISLILGISIYILRRQRVKENYHAPLEVICTKQQQQRLTLPAKTDYDNSTYDSFRTNIQLSSSDDNDSTPMTTSDDCTYEPKIVYLGGEQKLTAIFA
ncbi:unnamed protein product [Rotaria socialis]|uniref:EB domain-containing protein n=1 Tax=Rotaria socialis TaxID=392032 RepID=A0A817XB91_9BILA|nr:unnamed protein product [Rotaria socialis]CAF4240619.1 unnamed protein product [Rotaria socialis]